MEGNGTREKMMMIGDRLVFEARNDSRATTRGKRAKTIVSAADECCFSVALELTLFFR
jgi:hypothetical protein